MDRQRDFHNKLNFGRLKTIHYEKPDRKRAHAQDLIPLVCAIQRWFDTIQFVHTIEPSTGEVANLL